MTHHLDPVNRLLAETHGQILEEEAKVLSVVDRIRARGGHQVERDCRQEWDRFRERVKPLRDQYEHVLHTLVIIEAHKPIPAFVLSSESVAPVLAVSGNDLEGGAA